VVSFFQDITQGLKEVIPLKTILDLSKEMSEEVEDYHHCEYQAAIAATTLSNQDNLILVVSPTGSGKTWMQGLIAKYHCV
jgi:superfamily II DNA or RNA helicase